MGTICQIMVVEKKIDIKRIKVELNNREIVKIYKHWDGYPEGVIPIIKPFLEYFAKNRGINDTSYCIARLVQYIGNVIDQNYLLEDKLGSKCISLGIDTYYHIDIEFLYVVYPNIIEVYHKEYFESGGYDFILKDTIKLDIDK